MPLKKKEKKLISVHRKDNILTQELPDTSIAPQAATPLSSTPSIYLVEAESQVQRKIEPKYA
jgi:hypothetical protein